MAKIYNGLPEDTCLWICNQHLGNDNTCGYANHKDDKACKKCRARRDKGDKAYNVDKYPIANLIKVENGVEHWEYTT